MEKTAIILTHVQAKAVFGALVSLDGSPRIVQLGNGTQQVVQKPYKLSGKTRMAIARNIGVLNQDRIAFEKAHKGMIEEISGGEQQIDPSDKVKMKEFATKYDELLNEAVELPTLTKIKASLLNIEENDLPQTVLADLAPVLDDDIPVE